MPCSQHQRCTAAACRVLADGSVRAAADAERARAEKYYAEALASLARRQASAAPDRRVLLAVRADGVRAEEKRRLAEIDEKYTPRHEIRPYRLDLLYVPALRIPVAVLRGARRFPLVLEWLLPEAAFAPLRAPGHGGRNPRDHRAAAGPPAAVRAAALVTNIRPHHGTGVPSQERSPPGDRSSGGRYKVAPDRVLPA